MDTSVAVALVVTDHERHRRTLDALGDRRLGLCGHAAFETFSVLTRLPPPARRTPAAVARLLAQNLPYSRFLGVGAAATLLAELEPRGIAGGSVYESSLVDVDRGARHGRQATGISGDAREPSCPRHALALRAP